MDTFLSGKYILKGKNTSGTVCSIKLCVNFGDLTFNPSLYLIRQKLNGFVDRKSWCQLPLLPFKKKCDLRQVTELLYLLIHNMEMMLIS